LADGYFIISDSIGNYLGENRLTRIGTDLPEFHEAEQNVRNRVQKLLDVNGTRSVDSFHKELGNIMWENCGMLRNEAGLKRAIGEIADVREQFWKNVRVTGTNTEFNVALEQAGRVADFLEFAETLCYDALERDESCGAHFREEHQTPDGEAKRNDADYTHVSAWEYKGVGVKPELTVEPLTFESVELTTRSYK
jgi:succinate dehydrogenase / fumarate reductase flavoprotein subunit